MDWTKEEIFFSIVVLGSLALSIVWVLVAQRSYIRRERREQGWMSKREWRRLRRKHREVLGDD